MSDFNDAEVSVKVTDEYVQRVLRKTENDDSLEVVSLQTAPLVRKGENYMSIVLSVDVETKSEKNGEKTYNLVAKLAPADPGRMHFLVLLDVFPKENQVYNVLFHEFVRLQTRRGIENPKIPAAPKIYTPVDEKEMILLFENLKVQGFRIADKLAGLDYKHCKLVITELAQWHALSYALKQDTEPETLLEKYPFLEDKTLLPEFESQGKEFSKSNIGTVIKALEYLGPEYDHLKQKLEAISTTLFDTTNNLFKSKDGLLVIIHGDCWINNMMFRYDESDNPVEMKFVDLQVTRIANCSVDLNYIFYTSTTRDLRDNHMYELLELYQSVFKDTIHSVNAEEPPNFTFEELKKEFDRFKPIGLMYATILLPLMLARPDEAISMDNIMKPDEKDENVFAEFQAKMEVAMAKMVRSNDHFGKRLTGVLQELADDNVF